MVLQDRNMPVLPMPGEYWCSPTGSRNRCNGSHTFPFNNLQDAVDAIASQALPIGRLHLSPGVYTDALVVPQTVALIIEGAINGVVLLMGDIAWTVTGNFTVPGAPASALGFRNLTVVGKVTCFDGVAPGLNPLIFENCFLGEIDAQTSCTAEVVPAISGISNVNFSIANPTTSSVVRGRLRTKGDVILQSTDMSLACTEIRCKGLFAGGCAFNQSVWCSAAVSEVQNSRWKSASPVMTFTGAAGEFRVDRFTKKIFDVDQMGSVSNGQLKLVD